MKIITLLLVSIFTLNGIAQNSFTTGEQTLLNNLKAQIDIDGNTNTTTLTLKGPANAWFAIGFGGAAMTSGADIFRTNGSAIVDAKTTSYALPTADIRQDWTLISNTVSENTRTIIATRPNDTGDSNDYVFNTNTGSIPVMYAHGSSPSYSNHGRNNRGATTLGVTLNTKKSQLLNFDVSPNPSSDVINITLPSDTNLAQASIFDITGRLLKITTITLNYKTIDTSNLATGTYLIKVSSKNKTGTVRFIKK